MTKNEFPIIFIGAGISKRYLENYLRWEQLLENLWKEANDTNIYSYLNKVNERLKTQGIDNEFKRKFIANILVASMVEKEIDEFSKLFLKAQIIITTNYKENFMFKI